METSKNSTRQLTLDELIYSQEGSRANPTPSPESERERRTSATCGRRCCALFENAPRATSWAKTFAALLVGMEGWSSKRCVLTWKLKGTPYNRSYFQLAVSVLPTDETASGLLLTPTTREEVMDKDKFKERMEKYDNGTTVPNLATQVLGMLPTPTAFDYNTPRSQEAWDKAKEKHGDALQNPLKQMAAFGMLPTPIAGDWKGQRRSDGTASMLSGKASLGMLPTPTTDERDTKYAQGGTNLRAKLGTGSQLSPLFVEEMMGFPKNWTASPFQSGDENP